MTVYERLSQVLGNSVTIPRELGAVLQQLCTHIQDMDNKLNEFETRLTSIADIQEQIASIKNIKAKLERVDSLDAEVREMKITKPSLIQIQWSSFCRWVDSLRVRLLLLVQRWLSKHESK